MDRAKHLRPVQAFVTLFSQFRIRIYSILLVFQMLRREWGPRQHMARSPEWIGFHYESVTETGQGHSKLAEAARN